MNLPETESHDQVTTNEPAPVSPWTTPQLDKLPLADTAANSGADVADAGIFS
jgi:hypothetical protein